MGSEYEVDLETAKAIRASMQKFLREFPPGTRFYPTIMGETVPVVAVVVTGMSKCPYDERYPCEVELQHETYGGYANYSVETRPDLAEKKIGIVRISEADFPHPAEYIIAKKHIGIPVEKSEDWCITELGHPFEMPKYCSKRRW